MNNNIVRGFVVCLLSSLVISCASTRRNTIATAGDGKAQIYVLRPLSVLGGGGIVITDNGKTVGTLHRGGIVKWEREPGALVVGATAANDAQVSITVEPNQVYFIEVRKRRVAGSRSREVEIQPLSKDEGTHLLRVIQAKRDPLKELDSL